jgi:hypothetical protein
MVSRTLDAGYGLVHQSPLSGSRSFDDASVTLDVRRWTDSCQACHFDEIEIIWSCDVLTAGSSRPLRIRVSGVPRLGGDIVDLSGWVSVDGTGRYSVVKVEGQNFSAVVVEVEGHEALLRVNIP